MNDWEVVSNSGQEMVLVRGTARKALSCPNNRVGSRIFTAANPGQIFDEITIKLLLTDYNSSAALCRITKSIFQPVRTESGGRPDCGTIRVLGHYSPRAGTLDI